MPTHAPCPSCAPQRAPAWLNLRHSSEYGDVSPDTLRRAIDSGELPAYRTSPRGHLRIRVTDLDAWLAGELTARTPA